MEAIQTDKSDLINRIYQIMIVGKLNNLSCGYSSHYFIKYVGFILIYYFINLDIVSSCIVFSYLYFEYVNLSQV